MTGALATFSWAEVTPLGLSVTSAHPDWDEWYSDVGYLLSMENASQWGIGDAYRVGAFAFTSRDPTQAFSARRVRFKTIQNYAWVCGKYKFGPQEIINIAGNQVLRHGQRYWPPSFSHHAIVAKLEHPRRKHWLMEAVVNDYVVEDLSLLTAKERGLVEDGSASLYREFMSRFGRLRDAYRLLPDMTEKFAIGFALDRLEEAVRSLESAVADLKKAA